MLMYRCAHCYFLPCFLCIRKYCVHASRMKARSVNDGKTSDYNKSNKDYCQNLGLRGFFGLLTLVSHAGLPQRVIYLSFSNQLLTHS